MHLGRKTSIANTLAEPLDRPNRVELAFERGRVALKALASAEGISIAEARARFEASSRLGRRKSRAAGCP